MSEVRGMFVVEVQGGSAVPDAIRLHAGRVLQSTSIGAKGRWYVTGPGVRDLHADIKFDGADLYVRSASSTHPLRLAGAPLSERWTRVTAPCRISMGDVTLSFAALPTEGPAAAVGEMTRIEPISTELIQPSDTFQTLVDIPDAALGLAQVGAAPEEACATRIDVASPSLPPPVFKAPIDIPPVPQAPTAAAPPKGSRRWWTEWDQTPLTRKVMLLLLPFAFLSVRAVVKGRELQALRSSPSSAAASAAVGPPTSSVARPVTAPGPAKPTLSRSPSTPTGKTPERLAADAVASGAYLQAAAHYDTLAQEHPDQTTFSEAARILRSKFDASAP